MKKDFPKEILLNFSIEKQFKVLYDLAREIEIHQHSINSNHFEKLRKYHSYLAASSVDNMQKLGKEFSKIKAIDYQFQIYLMLLERFLGQSHKEYQFLIETQDNQKTRSTIPVVCILDSVRSAHNVGSFFRNAECLGAQKLFLCGLTPPAENAQVKKTAMGCDALVPWEYSRDLSPIIERLRAENYKIIAVETTKDAQVLRNWNIPDKPIALIFGHEQFGLSREALSSSDETIKISLAGQKNSLNVATCQAIILSHILSNLQNL